MTSTRLVAVAAFGVIGLGLILLVSEGSWWVLSLGAVMTATSGLVLTRHLWREAGSKQKTAFETLRKALAEQGARIDGDIESLRAGMSAISTRDDVADLRDRVELEVLTQLSGVVGVYSALSPSVPYPSFGRSAIAGDCAARLVRLVLARRPGVVVEAGSGLSTLLIARAMEVSDQDGVVISLEHRRDFAEATKALLREHGLEARARVVHAPLVPTRIGKEEFEWYDVASAELPNEIDLVFVDGPPGNVGPSARYPAIPVLYDRLRRGGVVLVDDANRKQEGSVIRRWKNEWPNLDVRYHKDMKGTAEIVKG